MAYFLVISLFFIFSTAFAISPEDWKEQLKSQTKSSDRIVFSEVNLGGDEAESIEEAQTKARAEMAKTFKVYIKTESQHERSTHQSNDQYKSSLSTNTSTSESTEGINFVGLDTTKYLVDKDKKIVVASAILNLSNFENYLLSKVKNDMKELNDDTYHKTCTTSEDLKCFRNKEKHIMSLVESAGVMATFRDVGAEVYQTINEQKQILKSCREKFKIQYVGEDSEAIFDLEKFVTQMGFGFEKGSQRGPSSNGIKFVVTKIISKPELKYEMIHVTGKVKIVLKRENGKESEWFSKTYRQIESNEEIAKRRMSKRLDGEILEGIKLLSEENL
jgi:hypothetical protein